MKKSLKAILIAMILISGSNLMGSSSKGQKIIAKKLKRPCGFNGAVLAKKHTQEEWKHIYSTGHLQDEIDKICPKARYLKNRYIKDVYDFLYNFASDSGNVPSC